jgi:hypothetical protein
MPNEQLAVIHSSGQPSMAHLDRAKGISLINFDQRNPVRRVYALSMLEHEKGVEILQVGQYGTARQI